MHTSSRSKLSDQQTCTRDIGLQLTMLWWVGPFQWGSQYSHGLSAPTQATLMHCSINPSINYQITSAQANASPNFCRSQPTGRRSP